MEPEGSSLHSHVLYAIYPTHLILPDIVTLIKVGEEYKSLNSPLCNFLHHPPISFLLCPNIFVSTLFGKSLSLCHSLNMSSKFQKQTK